MKLGIISLGCAKNLYDSEMMLGLIKKNNIQITNSMIEADIILINTCGFIVSAKEEAIDTIFEMLEYKKKYGKKILVTGCLVERYLETLREEIPDVDLFIPIHDYHQFGYLLANLVDMKYQDALSPTLRLLTTPKHWAYLRIGDGCDNHCTYCAIPLIRKNNVSRALSDILEEAEDLYNQGIKEIVLISQDTTRYGRDINNGISLLPDLLEKLALNYNFAMIRFLYTYPDEITSELVNIVAKYPQIAAYFDVPIQHASSEILKRMNRRGDREFLHQLFKNIRNTIPGVVLRTSIIVGFPGETEEDFEILKTFIQEIKFDRLGVFIYSPEEDTLSAYYPNQIEEKIKEKRYHELMKIQQKIAHKKNQEQIGTIHQVIIDKFDDKTKKYIGRSYMFAPDDVDGVIYITTEMKLNPGNIVEVIITDALIHDLIAVIRSV